MRPKSRGSVKRPNTAADRPSLSRLDLKRAERARTAMGADHRPGCLSSNVCLINKKCMHRRPNTVKTNVCYRSSKMFATHLRLIIRASPYSKAGKKWGPESRTVWSLSESSGRKSARGLLWKGTMIQALLPIRQLWVLFNHRGLQERAIMTYPQSPLKRDLKTT